MAGSSSARRAKAIDNCLLRRLLRLAGKIGELLDQRPHTFQPRLRQIPIGTIDEPLVGLDFQTAARILDQRDQPLGVCEPSTCRG